MQGLNTTYKRTVLVIEDNEINRDILYEILSPTYNVLLAENGRAGLDVLAEQYQNISLILLDIQMPVMNGYEFLDEVKNHDEYKKLPIIVTTSSSAATDEIKCLENGAIDFVSKPYNSNVVRRRVDSFIRFREAVSIISKVQFDDVTGTYNKDFFYINAEDRIRSNMDKQFDMVCIRVDAVKLIEDRYGEESLNSLLHTLAESVVSCCSVGSIAGRIGDDTFAVLCEHKHDDIHIDRANHMRTALKGSAVPSAAIKIGIYKNVDNYLPIFTICNSALLALEESTLQHGGSFAEFDSGMRDKVVRRHTVMDLIPAALEAEQFTVYYQAKYNFLTGRYDGAEALVRWFNPDLGFISPGEFIPIVETSGLVTALDYYMLEHVCRDLRSWLDEGKDVTSVSINLSRVDFEDEALVQTIENTLNKYNIPRSMLHLEVTESAYTDNMQRFSEMVLKLRALGLKVELDDFGSGYSTLSIINDIQMDVLKLDMSLVRSVESGRAATLVKHILSLAKELEMATVAEGVETISQAQLLKQMGCTYAQGFYYARPLPKAEFEKLIFE